MIVVYYDDIVLSWSVKVYKLKVYLLCLLIKTDKRPKCKPMCEINPFAKIDTI